jgi:NAD(P)-dependent dehydrogenase (short-subunit alcohol dehydrogenase family)
MRVALTGGATGIGAATAARLKRDGHEVISFDLNEPEANVDQWIKIDLSEPQSIDQAATAATGQFDALINNAGLPPREGLSELILNVNFFGMKQFMLAMLDKLKPGSAIVNTASRAGAMWRQNIDEVKALMALSGLEELPAFISERNIDHIRAYNLSKEAVIALTIAETEPLLARNLRINSVSPAAISTGILEDFKTAFGEKTAKAIERAGRAGYPEEVADVICFLLSEDSRWIKGQDITIDGGKSAFAQTDMLGIPTVISS